jgi:hypothetical protein
MRSLPTDRFSESHETPLLKLAAHRARSRLPAGAAAALLAPALLIMAPQPASAEIPVSPQYVCEIASGPIATQIAVVNADPQVGSPGMNNACGVPDSTGAMNADGTPVVHPGRVVFEHTAGLRQYVCDFSSGPLAGQLALMSRSTPPNVGEACTDGAGNTGTVTFVEQ